MPDTPVEVKVKVEYKIGGKVFQPADLTLGEAMQIEKDLELPWSDVHPLTQPAHAAALFAAFLRRTLGDAAKATAEAMTLGEWDDAVVLTPVTDEEVGGNPKDLAAKTTTPPA